MLEEMYKEELQNWINSETEKRKMVGILIGENSYIVETRLNDKLFDFIAYDKVEYIKNTLTNGF